MYVDKNGNYGYAGDIALEHPGWNYLTDPVPDGWHPVEDLGLPDSDQWPPGQVPVYGPAELKDGKWVTTFEYIRAPIQPPTIEQLSDTIDKILLYLLEN